MIKAVAAIFLYQDRVFTIKRQNSLRVFPGYHSFPGGKVDAEDFLEQTPWEAVSNLEQAHLVALRREVEEEVGVDLIHLFKQNIASAPELFGVAVSPPFNPYKFATYYYLIRLSQDIRFSCDAHEISSSCWESPSILLQHYADGKILCVPPFIKILTALQDGCYPLSITGFSVEQKIYDFSLQVRGDCLPVIPPLAGIEQLFVESPTLPPARFTNAFLIDGILVDPAPKDQREYQRLLTTLNGRKVRAIFITHHHLDHHYQADTLAKVLDVPILMSERCRWRIEQKYRDVKLWQVEIVTDGEQIGSWLGRPIKVMALGGHDDSQLCLYAADLSWFIAGDLFQYGATVVAGGDEGDMGVYQQSLQRVINLAPQVCFPSHGVGVGGTYWLQYALEHTYQRNKEIKQWWLAGASVEEILQKVYANLPSGLLKYAKKNVLSHIELIKRGGEDERD